MKKNTQLCLAVAIVAIGIGLMWFWSSQGNKSAPTISATKPSGPPSRQSIDTAVVMADGSVIARTKFSFGMASGINGPAVVLPRNNQR